MAETTGTELRDEDMVTERIGATASSEVGPRDTDGTDGDSDGTDGDSDGTDADGTDGDGTDSTDGDGTDADGTDAAIA